MRSALCQPHGVRGVSICNAVLFSRTALDACRSPATMNDAGVRIGRITAQKGNSGTAQLSLSNMHQATY